MSERTPEGDESDGSIDEYIFSCPACGQEIEVNDEMRSAILANGCPVCATEAAEKYFEK